MELATLLFEKVEVDTFGQYAEKQHQQGNATCSRRSVETMAPQRCFYVYRSGPILTGADFSALGTDQAHSVATGGTTISAPAVQQAVDHAEVVDVEADVSFGKTNRPSLMGTLVGKAASLEIMDDSGRERHVTDFLILALIVPAGDPRDYHYQPASQNHMTNMLGNFTIKPDWMLPVPEAANGIERLRISLQD